VALPMPLDGYGMPGCTLFTSVHLTQSFVAGAWGTWESSLGIPAGTAWRGTVLFAQAWLLDPWANALGASVSNAAWCTIGG
jgi:hypothetical protein